MGQFSVEKPVPPGSVLSGNQQPSTGGWRIVAVHDSKESWEHFRDDILMPQMKKGITGGFANPPEEIAIEVHNLQK